MADETKVQAQAAAEAPAQIAKAVADSADAVVTEGAKAARRERATVARRAKRCACLRCRRGRRWWRLHSGETVELRPRVRTQFAIMLSGLPGESDSLERLQRSFGLLSENAILDKWCGINTWLSACQTSGV